MSHLWIPRTKIIENRQEIVPPRTTVGGYFSIVGRLDDGRERVLAAQQPNLITNAGLDQWGVGNPMRYCSVGSGSTAPTVADTSLETFAAQHTLLVSTDYGAQPSEPYYGSITFVFRFNPPGADQVLTEVGVGWDVSGASLWSRALIKNSEGTPISVVWGAQETLDVTYQVRKYPWLVDVAYTTTIGSVTHTGVLRCAEVNEVASWPVAAKAQALFVRPVGTTSIYPRVYNGAIGEITAIPSGVMKYGTLLTTDAYVVGSHKRTGVYTVGPTDGNLAGGISALHHINSVGTYQMSISPPIAKVVDWTLTLNMKTPTWGRA